MMHEFDEWYLVIENLLFWNDIMKHDWMHWFCYALYGFISIPHDYVYFYRIRIINIIYKEFWCKNDINWQPDYIKDPTNGGKYVGNWFILKIYVASRPMIHRQQTSDSKGLCCQMIRSSLQDNILCYNPTTEKIWS